MPLRISAICRKQHSREREEEERLAAGSGPGANMRTLLKPYKGAGRQRASPQKHLQPCRVPV